MSPHIYSIVFRELHCAFPYLISPHLNALEEQMNNSLDNYSFSSEKLRNKYKKSRLSHLTARCFPSAPCNYLLAINKLTLYAFLADDLYLHYDSVSFAEVRVRQTNALKGILPEQEQDDLCRLLHALGGELNALNMSDEWFNRLVTRFEESLYAGEQEARYRNQKSGVPLEKYLDIRLHSIGAYMLFPLIELVNGFELPEKILQHEKIRRLEYLASMVIAFQNDLASFAKEVDKDGVNIVLLLQAQRSTKLEEAIYQALSMHNEWIEEFLIIRACMPDFQSWNRLVEDYVHGMEVIMHACLVWQFIDSERYFTYEKLLSSS